ncbi:MAG: hypothetical protein ACRCUS_03445 [Anaerovoracaceae bacterium]
MGGGRGAGYFSKTKGSIDNLLRSKARADAKHQLSKLPPDLRANIHRFIKGSSNKYTDFVVEKKPDGNYITKMSKPGDVPGSKAVYIKIIDSKGITVKTYKETYDPKGKLVHSKEKTKTKK